MFPREPLPVVSEETEEELEHHEGDSEEIEDSPSSTHSSPVIVSLEPEDRLDADASLSAPPTDPELSSKLPRSSFWPFKFAGRPEQETPSTVAESTPQVQVKSVTPTDSPLHIEPTGYTPDPSTVGLPSSVHHFVKQVRLSNILTVSIS